MATKNKSGIPDEIIRVYDEIIDVVKGVERRGAAMPYTSVNGHMFSFLTKDGSMALRLPAPEIEKFIKKHKTGLCEQHGTVLEEYVVVPDELLKDTKSMRAYFKTSFGYVSALKSKATTKSATAAKSTVPQPEGG